MTTDSSVPHDEAFLLCRALSPLPLSMRRAEGQTIEFRKDVPHPVGAFSATPDFRERLLVVVLLRVKEAVQVVPVCCAAKVA